MSTLDVKNVFNFEHWSKIIRRILTPGIHCEHLRQLIKQEKESCSMKMEANKILSFIRRSPAGVCTGSDNVEYPVR